MEARSLHCELLVRRPPTPSRGQMPCGGPQSAVDDSLVEDFDSDHEEYKKNKEMAV